MFPTVQRMFSAFPAVTVVKTDYTTKAQLKISSGRSLRTIKNYQSVPVAMSACGGSRSVCFFLELFVTFSFKRKSKNAF